MYEGLTRFELWEIFYMAREAASSDITFLVTILSAYLAVAFIAAKRLSKFQLVSISVIYSGSYFYSCVSFSTAYNTVFEIMGILTGLVVPAWINGFYVILLITWVISILFMIQARREKDS